MARRLRENADEPVSRQGWVEAMSLPGAYLPYRGGRYDPFGKSSANDQYLRAVARSRGHFKFRRWTS